MDATLEREVERLGRSSRVAALITVLGVIGVGLAMIYATFQLHSLQSQVIASKTELAKVNDDLAKANRDRAEAEEQVHALQTQIRSAEVKIQKYQEQISELQKQLSNTADLSRSAHPIDWDVLKSIAIANAKEARVLQKILELKSRKVPWHLGGTQPDQGFDSPTFAAYVLQSVGLLPGSQTRGESNLVTTSQNLRSMFPATQEPRVGDLMFYPKGFALFYFVDHRRKPFVIGMTPEGIVSLEPDFLPTTGIVRPSYHR